jgi:hypothetical protein
MNKKKVSVAQSDWTHEQRKGWPYAMAFKEYLHSPLRVGTAATCGSVVAWADRYSESGVRL